MITDPATSLGGITSPDIATELGVSDAARARIDELKLELSRLPGFVVTSVEADGSGGAILLFTVPFARNALVPPVEGEPPSPVREIRVNAEGVRG